MFYMRVEWKWSIFMPFRACWTDSSDFKGDIKKKDKIISRKKTATFLLLLRVICTQKKSEIDFPSLTEEIRFYPIFL